MKAECCHGERPAEETNEPKKVFQPFQDICTYFSEEEWAKLTNWQKSVYMYMKRNYIRMTGLGVKVNQPVFMRCKEQVEANGKEKDSEDDFYTQQIKRIKLTRVTVDLCDIRGKLGGRDSISASSIMPGVSTVRVNAWSHRLRERKTRVIYEEISDPEEDDDGDDDDDNNDDDDYY